MQLFLDNKKTKDFLYEDEDMSDLLNEFNQKQETEIEKFLKGNILGEFAKLAIQLLKQGVGVMKSLKKNVLDKALKSDEELRKEEE